MFGYIKHDSESAPENLSRTTAQSLVSYVGDRLQGARVTVIRADTMSPRLELDGSEPLGSGNVDATVRPEKPTWVVGNLPRVAVRVDEDA